MSKKDQVDFDAGQNAALFGEVFDIDGTPAYKAGYTIFCETM